MLTAGVSISGLAGESLRNEPSVVPGPHVGGGGARRIRSAALRAWPLRSTGGARRSSSPREGALRRAPRAPGPAVRPLRHLLRPASSPTVGRRSARPVPPVRFPLYSPSITRTVLAIGWTARADAEVHTEIRRRAGLPIDDIEFAKGSGWPASRGSPPPPRRNHRGWPGRLLRTGFPHRPARCGTLTAQRAPGCRAGCGGPRSCEPGVRGRRQGGAARRRGPVPQARPSAARRAPLGLDAGAVARPRRTSLT